MNATLRIPFKHRCVNDTRLLPGTSPSARAMISGHRFPLIFDHFGYPLARPG